MQPINAIRSDAKQPAYSPSNSPFNLVQAVNPVFGACVDGLNRFELSHLLQKGVRIVDIPPGKETLVQEALVEAGLKANDVVMVLELLASDFLDLEKNVLQKTALLQKIPDYILIKEIYPGMDIEAIFSRLHMLKSTGVIKEIAVKNFNIDKLLLLRNSGFTPALNQIEITPDSQQDHLIDFCQGMDIKVYFNLSADQLKAISELDGQPASLPKAKL